MPKENSPAEWMPKVHFQTGGIRPISDRHPQGSRLVGIESPILYVALSSFVLRLHRFLERLWNGP